MQTKTNLKIDWATHEAAKFACNNWHYSKSLTGGNLVKIGAWENGVFIGVIIFGRGPNNHIGLCFGLTQFQAVELVRVAFKTHITPISRIISIALKFLKKQSPKLMMIISYADPLHGHHGGIYQAGNWIYIGTGQTETYLKINGVVRHRKSIGDKYGTSSLEALQKKGILCSQVKVPPKHKYLMPLDEAIRKKVEHLRKPYPKRATSKDNVASGFQSEEGGVNPTVALQTTELLNA